MNKSIRDRRFYSRIAELHATSIDQGFLSTLGAPFLALMYRAIDESHDSFLIVEEEAGNPVGFIAGAWGMRSIYRRMLARWPQVALALAPVILSPRKLRRILNIVRYTRGQDHPSALSLPNAELLSIAVDDRHRRGGRASTLYQALCDRFREAGISEFKIVVGGALEPAHNFYRRMGATPIGIIEVHAGQKSVVYLQGTELLSGALKQRRTFSPS